MCFEMLEREEKAELYILTEQFLAPKQHYCNPYISRKIYHFLKKISL